MCRGIRFLLYQWDLAGTTLPRNGNVRVRGDFVSVWEHVGLILVSFRNRSELCVVNKSKVATFLFDIFHQTTSRHTTTPQPQTCGALPVDQSFLTMCSTHSTAAKYSACAPECWDLVQQGRPRWELEQASLCSRFSPQF